MSEIVNRAFMYGESVFTTMRLINGRLQDWEYHFERLKNGVEFVYGPFARPDDWVLMLKNRLEERVQSEEGDKVIRLTIYREQARGLVKTGVISVNDLKINLTSFHYDAERTEGKTFKLRTCSAPIRPHWWPSYLKAGDYLETILSQKMNMKPGDDDVLFLSTRDTVLESSVANIFVVRHNRIYTAPLGPNVLSGVMRRKVLEVAADYFESCTESETSLAQLMKADGVFGSNSVRGLFLVDRIDDRDIEYSKSFLSQFELMRKRVHS